MTLATQQLPHGALSEVAAAPSPHPDTVSEPPATSLLPPVPPALTPPGGSGIAPRPDSSLLPPSNGFGPDSSPLPGSGLNSTNLPDLGPLPDLTPAPASTPEEPRKPDTPFVAALRQAYAAYDAGDFDAALRYLGEADTLKPRDLNVYTMRATCYLKKKQYAQAEEWYRKALDIDPAAQAPRFSLAETLFLQKKYTRARVRFDGLLKSDPGNDVLRYKVYLCALCSREVKEADAIRKRFDIMAYTPVYHYAQAAWHFSRGESDEGHMWVNKAQEAYHPRDFIIFEDSLINLGFLPNPFNGKGSESPAASPSAVSRP
ncbi:MAG: tetratricopeptide repeat protein [Candidatus Methylacidiphilales bacterium]|nr:tetratricopeptide repeat protein [Candidatus Methylacidiphilales bacterium]